MKILNKIWGIGLIAISTVLITPKQGKAQEGGYVTDQEFYDNLQPYGTWVSDERYGSVWVPDVDEDFRPYATRGHWVLTDYGNTWVSDYPWGWATFHYGRWRYDDYYGWEWVPGHRWAPAWVSWRHGGGYYGWAPLMPGISISVSFGGGYHVPDNYWVCAPQAYINRPDINNYYVPPTRSVTIIHNTTIINNTYVNNKVTYVAGPRPQEIRQVTHNNDIKVYNIGNAARPGAVNITNNTVNIYRPAVKAAPEAHPARVVDANAYRTQHANDPIANRANASVNHGNAAKLATIARSSTPDNRVVRVNQPVARPQTAPAQSNGGQPANKQPQRTPQQPQAAPQQAQQPARQPGGRHANRPAQQPQPAAQQGQQPAKQPQAAPQQAQQPARQPRQQRPNQPAQQPQPAAQQAAQQAQQQQAQQKAAQQAQQQQAQQQRQQQAAQQAQQKATQQAQQQQAQQQRQAAQQAQQQRAQQAAQQQQAQKAQQQQAQNAQRQQQAAQQRQQQAQRQRQQPKPQQPKPQQAKPQPPKPDANQ